MTTKREYKSRSKRARTLKCWMKQKDVQKREKEAREKECNEGQDLNRGD